jgi:hypothetical protein
MSCFSYKKVIYYKCKKKEKQPKQEVGMGKETLKTITRKALVEA